MFSALFMATEFLSILKKRKQPDQDLFMEPKRKKLRYGPIREFRWNLILLDDRNSPLSRSFVLGTSEKWFLSPEQANEDAKIHASSHNYKSNIWKRAYIKIVLECRENGKETI
jgi:hypothetical protein